jgi:hypothetical protein
MSCYSESSCADFDARGISAAGRVFALEMAFYVSTETISLLLGGVMFDKLHLSTRGVASVMAAIGFCCAVSHPAAPSCSSSCCHAAVQSVAATCSTGKCFNPRSTNEYHWGAVCLDR